MLGRAVQLTFPTQSPGEEHIKDSCTANHYLDMCLKHPSGGQDLSLDEIRKLNENGQYLWGDYQKLIINPPPDVRVLNLETAVTKSIHNKDVPMWKGIRYHFHTDNVERAMGAYARVAHGVEGGAPSPVVLSYANNHCMDYGRTAFDAESLPALSKSDDFRITGCGKDFSEASKPAVVQCKEKGTTVEVFAFSTGCSGTPEEWHASENRSGLVGLPGLYNKASLERAFSIAKEVLTDSSGSMSSSPRHVRIVSIHWGPNWAMKGEGEDSLVTRQAFAHRLIDECNVDLIYGHSSHHVRGIELYNGKLILYGTGDLINDYEGFENLGEERYITLGGIFVADLDADSGFFRQLRVVPMYMNRLRLERYKKSSGLWRPNEKRLEVNSAKTEEFCRFINSLSRNDSRSGVSGSSKDHGALLLEHFDSDSEIPGGPILKSKLYST